MQYKLITTEFTSYVERINDDGTCTAIPLEPSNSDYQAYLEHEAEAQ